jgi:glycogen debranching enzyme
MPKNNDKYYISTTSSKIDPYRHALKDEAIFGLFDRFGDILPLGKNEQGLYTEETRFLSHYELKINGMRPQLLSSSSDEDSILLNVDLTNPDIFVRSNHLIKRDTIHILRSKTLSINKCFEHIRIKSFGHESVSFSLDFTFDSDFKNIFEVRGLKRKKRGELLSPDYKNGVFKLAYKGLDNVKRTTSVNFSKIPDEVRKKTFKYKINLQPNATENIFITIDCITGKKEDPSLVFDEAIKIKGKKINRIKKNATDIFTSNEQFNESIKRSISDINMMITKTEHGYYPYGGIPWFCTPFGRDGIITALECIWIKPEVAKGVLYYLAATQAQAIDKEKVAEPGKIMHETRTGELVTLKEIPFGRYYGSVDSTPLFIILAGAYHRRTGDTGLIRKIWGNIEKALFWIENYGDVDGDGFLEYTSDKKGLHNQGWKDSHDSVFHKDGSFAEGHIALCEVQCYLYAAKKEASFLAELIGKDELSKKLSDEADNLKKKFNEVFWDEKMGSYVLALDGAKKPCKVLASNAGHALFTKIADSDKAKKLAEKLTSPTMFTGWGIRTLADAESRYNPISYHNGSVWPHDNALIACGLASYGLSEHFTKVFTGIFDTSIFMDSQRLPELFCGFHRRKGVPPTLYPSACSPQTWAAGSLILMLQAALGISFKIEDKTILFNQPRLPEFLKIVSLKNLKVTGNKSVDLLVRRYGNDVTIETIRKPDDINILIIK